MKSLTSFVLAAVGVVVVVASPFAAKADTVAYQTLPVLPASAQVTPPPTPPEKIAATSHADGFYPAILPAAQRKAAEEAGYRYVQVFTSDKEAQAYAADGTLTTSSATYEPQATRTCMSGGSSLLPRLSFYFRTKPYQAPKPSPATIALLKKEHRWPPPVVKPSKVPPKDTVNHVRLERLTQTGDAVTVETSEAFVDLQTLGSQPIPNSSASSKLVKVATGPNGLGVYAARDDKGASQILVTNPQLPPTASDEDRQAEVQHLTATANRLLTQLPSGASSETGCGYVKLTLSAKPGAGEMATVLATAFLPPIELNPDEGGQVDESRFETDEMTDEQRKQVHDMVHRENRSQRARTVAINMSLSQLESEPAPVLSVTFGWASKDQQLKF